MREVWISLVAGCVRIPGEIEPELRPALAVARIGEQGVDQLPIGILGCIVHECLHLLRRRRQADEVKVKSTYESASISFRRERHPDRLQLL